MMILGQCVESDHNQQWWPFGFSVQLMSAASGQTAECLAVGSDGIVAGAGLLVVPCNRKDDTQVFTLTEGRQITNHGLYLDASFQAMNTSPDPGAIWLSARPADGGWFVASNDEQDLGWALESTAGGCMAVNPSWYSGVPAATANQVVAGVCFPDTPGESWIPVVSFPSE